MSRNEVSNYIKYESSLLSNKPDEITSFSSTNFVEEVRVFCPKPVGITANNPKKRCSDNRCSVFKVIANPLEP